MADENPLYPQRDSFDDRWGGLPVETPRFNYTAQSSLIESEPRKIEPYKLTPVEGDPFERAAERLRAPYKNVNDPDVGKFEKDDRFPYRSNIPVMASPFVHMAEGVPGVIGRGLTSFKDIAEGNLQVNDPMTGMLTPEAAMRGLDAASLGGAGGLVGGVESGAVLGVVPIRQAKSLNVTRGKHPEVLKEAVENTPGAKIDADGDLVVNVRRGQHPLQEGEESVRGGVFYLPEGSKNARHYSGKTNNTYGGTQQINGETAFLNPLVVKGATGGKAPQMAYDQLVYKGAYDAMRSDALKVTHFPNGVRSEVATEFLKKYAPDMVDKAQYIVQNSTKGNQLPYALQEAAVAYEARKAGHDGVIGYSVGRGDNKKPFLSEIYDVRESHYPDTEGGYTLHPQFLSDTQKPGMAVAAMRHPGYPAPEVIDRVYPAIRNLETGKVSTTNRGNEHADILHKLWVKEGGDPRVDTMELYRNMLPRHETGFYDPKTKQFHSKSEEEWRNLDTPDLNARQAMRSGMVFSDTQKPGMALAAAQPFYSAVENAVSNIKQAKMPADQWLGTLNNAKGVKPEEMDWIGLKEHLAGKGKEPVTKQEIQDFVNANKVELKEVNKGDLGGPKYLSANEKNADKPKFSQYQLPGGENYREKLLTLPNDKSGRFVPKLDEDGSYILYDNYYKRPYKNQRGAIESFEKEDIGDARELANKLNTQSNSEGSDFRNDMGRFNTYTSSHWDEPNVLAHVRMNDRTIEGKKSLHLEEIQSDWHQTGRDKGYKGTDKNLSPVDAAAIDAFGVPNAPFKKNWHELVLKRMLREAAEKGYDRLSWTPGEAQAARYDLSKQINKLHFTKTTDGKGYLLSPETHSGQEVPVNNGLPIAEKDLANYIGKETADKIIKQNVDDSKIHTLENIDLKVGGEGMKGFYDKMIPNAIEKIGKEHGVKVKQGSTEIDSTPYRSQAHFIDWAENRAGYSRNQLARKWAKGESDPLVKEFMESKKPQSVHYIDIPQSLKDQALGKGFPLFSGGHIFTPVVGNPHDQNK